MNFALSLLVSWFTTTNFGIFVLSFLLSIVMCIEDVRVFSDKVRLSLVIQKDILLIWSGGIKACVVRVTKNVLILFLCLPWEINFLPLNCVYGFSVFYKIHMFLRSEFRSVSEVHVLAKRIEVLGNEIGYKCKTLIQVTSSCLIPLWERTTSKKRFYVA